MSSDPLRIAVLGGVPASLGGGGLEVQIRETSGALARRGHEVFHVAQEPHARPFDILHAFSAEASVCQDLAHWRRNPAPLVVSPVIVVAPGTERRERLAARMPLQSYGPRARADLLRRADLTIAQTQHELALVRSLGASDAALIPNGVTPVRATEVPTGTPPAGTYALLLGTVSARKRQEGVVRALTGVPVVIAGGFDGSAEERATFDAALDAAGPTATWLGEVADPGAVRALLAGARALVHLSSAEGQSLALIEALSVGTPIVVSKLPANIELHEAYANHVHLVDDVDSLPAVLANLPARPPVAPRIPTWDDVAELLEPHYRTLTETFAAASRA